MWTWRSSPTISPKVGKVKIQERDEEVDPEIITKYSISPKVRKVKMQERDEEVDPDIITNYLTKGQ